MNEELWLTLLMLISIWYILILNNEIIFYGEKNISILNSIAVTFLTGIIFYFFINFLPKINKRKNAQRELNIVINDLTGLISLIIKNYYSSQKLWEVRFFNNPSKYIYSNVDEISKYIGDNLKLDDIIKFEWNKEKKLSLRNEFFKTVNKFNVDYREIRLKYGDYLENETLDNLEQIYRSCIFSNIREHDYLSQNDVCEITIKKLLQNMYNIQKTANKINDICKK